MPHDAPTAPFVLALVLLAPQGATQDPPRPVDAAARRMNRLVDAFHAAMPTDPQRLREPTVRAKIAGTALPAIRALEAAVRQRDDVVRAGELAVYAEVLGDRRDAREQETEVDLPTRLRRAAAAVITASDADVRLRTVVDLGAVLAQATDAGVARDAAMGAAIAVVRAAGLEQSEAEQLAACAKFDEIAKLLNDAAERASRDPRRRLGQPLALVGELRSGAAFTTAALHGKVVLVDFWATWCAPCKAALPELVRLSAEFGGRGLEIVGVSCDQDADALAGYLEQHPEIAWPQMFDADRPGWHALATSLGVTAIPRVFLIDRRGMLRNVDASGAGLEKLVAELVAERLDERG